MASSVQTGLPVTSVVSTQDLTFNAAGGSSVRSTQLTLRTIRLALGKQANVRLAIGDVTVTATAAGFLFVGPGTEFFQIESGQYIAAISDDTTTGTLNVSVVN